MSTNDSRFNPFKFSQKPPPLPPKDPVYLQRNANRSFASLLSPEIHPPSPITPAAQYATLKPTSGFPNSPMLNPAHNLSSSSVPTPQAPSPRPASKSGKLSFLRFSKRSPKSPTTPDDEPPKEDDNISMPWGFSHNIHVDEGFMGLPPSWSASLSQLGFSAEEIAAIQAKRAGARSPHDLKYIYVDRPKSPAAPVPVLANPTPRSTSLHQQSPPQPVASSSRIPPPKRKPPSPIGFESAPSHRNQPSQSTLRSFSTDSHAHTTQPPPAPPSHPYQWPPSQSTSNLSTHSNTDENLSLALAPLRLGSETTEQPSQPPTRFAIANPSSDDAHDAQERVPKHSIWGTKRPTRKDSTKDSSRGEPHPDVSHFSISPPPAQSSWATSLATAGSSLAASVHKVKGAAEKGLGRVRGKGGSLSSRDNNHTRQRSQETQDTHGHDTTSDSNSNSNITTDVLSIGPNTSSDAPVAKPAIWQMYSRPRAGTDASLSNPALSRSNSNGSPAMTRSASQGQLRAQYAAAGWTVPAINPDLVTIPSSTPTRKTRPRSNSHGALQYKGSKSSLGSVGIASQHKYSSSSTSLESIPEASPALLPPVMPPQLTTSKSQPHLPSHGHKPSIGSSNLNPANSLETSTSSATVASAVPPSMQRQRTAGNKPPRLSLHQSKGSSDLALWSASLLNNISLGVEKDLDLGFKLDFEQFGSETAKPGPSHSHKPSSSFSKSASSSSSNLAASTSSTSSSRLVNGGPTRKRSKERLPPAKPAPPSDLPPPPVPGLTGKPHPYAAAAPLGASSSSTLSGRSRSNSRSGTDREDSGAPPPRPPPAPALFSPPLPPMTNGAPPTKKEGTVTIPPLPLPPTTTSTPNPLKAVPTVLPLTAASKINPASFSIPNPPSTLPNVPVTAGPPDTGFLSPPPTAWATRGGTDVGSPGALSSNGPDSAQLWNEIELMMDPGLSLGMSMGVVGGNGGVTPVRIPLTATPTAGGGGGGVEEGHSLPKTVGELVGMSPTREIVVASSGLPGSTVAPSSSSTTTNSKPTPAPASVPKVFTNGARKSGRRKLGPEDLQSLYSGDSDEDYSDEDELSDGEDPSVRIGRVQQVSSTSKATIAQTQASRKANGSSRSRERAGPIGRLQEEDMLDRGRDPNRDSSRSSTSTLTVSGTTMVVGGVSIARRMDAYVIDQRDPSTPVMPGYPGPAPPAFVGSSSTIQPRTLTRRPTDQHPAQPPSPLSSTFDSEESGGSFTTNSSTSQPTPTDPNSPSPLNYYLNGIPTSSPREPVFKPPPPPLPLAKDAPATSAGKGGPAGRPPGVKTTEGDVTIYEGDPYGGYMDMYDDEADEDQDDIEDPDRAGPTARPTIVINDAPFSASAPTSITTGSSTPSTLPQSPLQRYRGWLSEVVAPLEEFIDSLVDPREHYLDLKEIGESGSGSVYQALLSPHNAHKLNLSGPVKDEDALDVASGRHKLVAIKSVAIVPSGSPKLADIRHELELMKGLKHDHVLGMDAVYVDLVDDALWIRMELMERSLADLIGLVGYGLMLQDRMIARFASDVLHGLEFLQRYGVAHRDIRSDNLLINKHGLLKITDFSVACRVPRDNPIRTDPAGVLYWQAPEILRGPYNALKVDVWSLGATVWEMAQTEPPFIHTDQGADSWPPLSEPQFYSPAFHDFLRKCSEPAATRPEPQELLKSSFINNACGRPVIVQALSQCMAIEEAFQGE